MMISGFRRHFLAFIFILIMGSGGAIFTGRPVEAQAADFQLIVSPPSVNTPQNEAAQYAVRVQSVNGFTGTVTYTVENLPTIFSASFSPAVVSLQASGNSYSILTVLAPTTVSTGTFSFTIVATATGGGPAPKRQDVNLTVYQIGQPDFVITVNPSQQFITNAQFQAQTFTSTITVTPRNSFFGTVTFTLNDQPIGLFATFDPLQVVLQASATTSQSVFRVNVFSGFFATTTFYFLAISGTGTGFGQPSGVTRTVIFQLGVSAQPDFTITGTPAVRTVNPGDTATYSIKLNAAQGGFGGNIQLALTGQPPEASFSFDPQPATLIVNGIATSTLTVNTTPRIAPDRYTLTVSATGSGVTKTFDIQLVINPVGDFTVTADPPAIALGLANTRTVTIKVQATGGFASVINFDVTQPGSGSGLTASVQPTQLVPTGGTIGQVVLVLATDRNAITRTNIISVTAKSGQIVRDVRVSVAVRQSFGCLIATAAYGSASAPPVQFLRDYRDGSIEASAAGQAFMNNFNGWYYSFSPQVANSIAGSEPLRQTFMVGLYPLMVILQASSGVYSSLPKYHEVAAVLAGVVASLLMGLTYISIPAVLTAGLVKRGTRNASMRKLSIPAISALAMSGLILALGELTGSSITAGIGATGLVVSLSLASAIAVYAMIYRK